MRDRSNFPGDNYSRKMLQYFVQVYENMYKCIILKKGELTTHVKHLKYSLNGKFFLFEYP